MDESHPQPVPSPAPSPERKIPCAACGYDLRGIALGGFCPECGIAIVQFGDSTQSNGKAVASMVLGIVSIVTCMLYGIPSLICGVIALRFHKSAMIAIQTGKAPPSSMGMAKAGKVCGIIGLCLGGIYFGFILVFFILGFAASFW